MRRVLIALAAALALPATAASAAAAAPKLAVSATPALFPAFSPGIHDYVSRCNIRTPLDLTITAKRGTKVGVGGKRPKAGSQTRKLALHIDQRAHLVATRGKSRSRYSIRCLPADFPDWTVEKAARKPQAQWYLTTPTIALGKPPGHYAAFFDRNGVPVWWSPLAEKPDFLPSAARLLANGHVVLARRIDTFAYATDPRQRYEEHRLDGSTVRVLKTVGNATDDHDYAALSNGNHMLITYRPRCCVDLSPYGGPSSAAIVDGELQEINPKGKVVWRWSTKDHVSLDEVVPRWWSAVINRTAVPPEAPYDPVHVNAFDVRGNRILVSARQTDSVWEIDRKSGKVVWKLGGTHTTKS